MFPHEKHEALVLMEALFLCMKGKSWLVDGFMFRLPLNRGERTAHRLPGSPSQTDIPETHPQSWETFKPNSAEVLLLDKLGKVMRRKEKRG